ncbi:AraC family transcriptional regulator, partial [filamentous cyanobacterium CCP5]
FSRHTHDGYAIGMIEAGTEEFFYRGATHQAHRGELVIIHPGEVHTGHAGEAAGWCYRMLYPSVDWMVQSAEGVGGADPDPHFFQPVIADPVLVNQFRRLHQALETSDSQLERQSRLLAWMSRLIQRHGERRCWQPSGQKTALIEVRQAQDYLHSHYAKPVSLEQLAGLTQLPPIKLLRSFRRVTGLPPHAYQVQLRVRQSKRLLAAGLPIVQVAADTGFADQSHLNRHFKRLVGVTPGQYIRLRR